MDGDTLSSGIWKGLRVPSGIMSQRTNGRLRLGREVRRLRRDLGITQTQLARKLGVTQRTVSDYEIGRSTPGPDMLARLCAALGVSADSLLGLKRLQTTPVMSVSISRVWNRFKQIQSLSTKDQRAVWQLITSLSERRSP
jgi:transcriptional regulator with XRE-family HTH domain